MEALRYETLIRTAHQCGTDESNGANADVYRQMQMAFDILSDNHWGTNKHDKEFVFKSKFIEVKKHVSTALKEGCNRIYYDVADEDLEILDQYISELRALDFYDKHKLDMIIDEALVIFNNNGMIL